MVPEAVCMACDLRQKSFVLQTCEHSQILLGEELGIEEEFSDEADDGRGLSTEQVTIARFPLLS